jgi:hypothetical protein
MENHVKTRKNYPVHDGRRSVMRPTLYASPWIKVGGMAALTS